MRKSAQLFPNQQPEAGLPINDYDYDIEPALPRDFFFDPDFSFDNINIEQIKNDYLTHMDKESFEFLTLPEKQD